MCWKCGKNNETKDFVEFRAKCEHCGADFHACKNCRHFAPGRHYDCAETVEEQVFDKEKANFCEYFQMKTNFSDNTKASENAKSAFNALFKE